jgi:hypothetical protein
VYGVVHSPANEIDTKVELTADLNIVLYSTEAAARSSQEKCGGIVLEVSAQSLRTQMDGHEVDGLTDMLLVRTDEDFDPSPATAFVTAFFGNIPHAPEDEDGCHAFNHDPVPWFDELEKELKVFLHQ